MPGRIALVLVALTFTATAARATVIDDLCAATDPCVVAGTRTIDPNTTLDLAGRDLTLAVGAKVSWTGDLTVLNADHCDFQERSKLSEATTTAGTHFLELDCRSATLAGTITTLGAGILVEGDFGGGGDGPYLLSGTIRAKGDEVGVIAIDSYGSPGDITIAGKIQVRSKIGTPPGEFRLITNFGNISIPGKIQVKGAIADPFSEHMIIEAGTGTLTVDGTIDARMASGAYSFNLESNAALVFGPKSKIKATAKMKGAEMAINSQVSTVTLRGKIQANARDVTGGDGPKVRVCAGDDIFVEDRSSIEASAGFDGSIIIGAFDVARVQAGARLLSKTDGDIEVCGNTSGSISPDAMVVPDPEAVGSGVCLSPESQVIFDLDCAG